MYINKNNLLKYLIQFFIVSLTVYNLSPCKIKIYFSMLIGLISDTHVRLPGTRVQLSTLTTEELPIQIKDAFKGVELILHAGDVYSIEVLDMLETIAPVVASSCVVALPPP